ncbi:conserved hypothetical protein, secreted [Candidatus Magnetomorum sp. HK-1]|nr:conserved hypothetical protein, secreted [Candidatus Magnetomorum sp. HK-1]
MSFIYALKRLIMSMSILLVLTCLAQAEPPVIQDFYPKTVNINTSQSALVIFAENLSDPLTVVINGESVPYTKDVELEKITCTIPPMETSGSVIFTVQNIDGISNEKILTYADCSDLNIQLPSVYPYKNIDITLNNDCYTQYKYKLDENAWSEFKGIENPIQLRDLEDGPHSLIIIGKDSVNNQLSSEPKLFTINTTEPEIYLHNLPQTLTTQHDIFITVTAKTGDPVEYLFRLNGIPSNEMISITDPINLTSLDEGVYTLCVTSVNDLGVWQSLENAACHTWEIIDLAIAHNSITPTEVLAGTKSCVYTTNYTGENVIFSWEVHNENGDQIGDTAYGESFSFTPPTTGAYAGLYKVSMAAKANGQDLYNDEATVKVPFTIETDQYTIIKDSIFRVKGTEAGATLIWDILANENDLMEVENSELIGRWERVDASSLNMTFYPADVDKITNFWVRVSVEDDLDLTEENGLHQLITGPYNILPMAEFTIILSDENGLISTTTNNDITVHDMVLLKNQNLTSPESKVVFELPDSGGTYRFSVKDNRVPPVYMEQTFSINSKETTVVLQHVGLDTIVGSVENTDGNILNNVQVAAFPMGEKYVSYKSQTAANGKYTLYLPELAPIDGWSVIAGMEGYASSLKTNQQLNSEILFSGTDALQSKTVITMVEPMGDKIYIRANPIFTASSQIDVYRIQADGKNTYYDEINFNNGLITIATPNVTDYTLIIMADTVENGDPDTGYAAYHAYRKNLSDRVLKRVDSTIDIFGGTISLTNENQTMKVTVPVNGITRTTTLTLEQIEKTTSCNATSGSDYIYAVHATSSQGKSLASGEINQILISLPFNLRDIQAGDLENGIWFLYRANSLEDMEAHKTELIPVTNILQSNYLGDGKIGYVTFLVDHLSVFAIGKPADIVPPTSTPSVILNDSDDGGDCFISVAKGQDFSMVVLYGINLLLILIVSVYFWRKKIVFSV